MAERLAPVDERTGLPLPILPVIPDLHFLRNSKLYDEYSRPDRHHSFYPNASLTTEAERVVRHSRLQFGARWNHDKYHRFYDAAPQPLDDKTCFNLGVLAIAGYVPEVAVDTTGKRPVIKRLDEQDRVRLQHQLLYPEERHSKETGKDLYEIGRGSFFMRFALAQDFDHIKEHMLEEFLQTNSRARRLQLGVTIVDLALWRASEEVDEVYKGARKEGKIPKSKPKNPVSLLRGVVNGHQPDYFRTIRKHLTAA